MTHRVFLLLLFAFFSAVSVVAWEGPYSVSRTVDGDTIELTINGKPEKVRLIGVDTPETVHPSKPVEFFGKEASAYTKQLLINQNVFLSFDRDRRDRYGRILAYVYRASDSIFVNLAIIQSGHGHAYTRFPFKYLEQFRQAEKAAREAERGLWGKISDDTAHVYKNEAGGDIVVFITKTGKKYHKEGCRSLSRSKIEIKLRDATPKYEPCNACVPPTLKKE